MLLLGASCTGGWVWVSDPPKGWSTSHTFASEGGGWSTQLATDSKAKQKMPQHGFEIDFRPGGANTHHWKSPAQPPRQDTMTRSSLPEEVLPKNLTQRGSLDGST